MLAVQGPKSAEVLDALGLPSELDYVRFVDADFDGQPVRVCRTGYTGEHGYELIPAWADAAGAVGRPAETARPRRHAGRAGRARHPAHRDGLPAARPGPDRARSARCRPARRWAVGWKKHGVLGPGRAAGRKAAGPPGGCAGCW